TSLWLLHLCAIDVERGRVIHTLVAEAYPLVELRLRITVFITHVPFAEEAGFVTFLLHILGKEREPPRQRGIVIYDGMGMGVLPRENRSPARRAQRGRDKGVLEMRAFRRHTVHKRSLQSRHFIHKTHEIKPVVITQDENDIVRLVAGLAAHAGAPTE